MNRGEEVKQSKCEEIDEQLETLETYVWIACAVTGRRNCHRKKWTGTAITVNCRNMQIRFVKPV